MFISLYFYIIFFFPKWKNMWLLKCHGWKGCDVTSFTSSISHNLWLPSLISVHSTVLKVQKAPSWFESLSITGTTSSPPKFLCVCVCVHAWLVVNTNLYHSSYSWGEWIVISMYCMARRTMRQRLCWWHMVHPNWCKGQKGQQKVKSDKIDRSCVDIISGTTHQLTKIIIFLYVLCCPERSPVLSLVITSGGEMRPFSEILRPI